jgi:ribosomal protein L37E
MINNLLLQFGGNTNIMDYILIGSMIVLVIAFTITSRSQRSKKLLVKKPKIKTELICSSCGFKEIREFHEGDYISKDTDEKCKRCGENMKVNLIYSIEETKKKKL